MNGVPIGACLFKKVVQLTYVDTMATASHICETLMDMHLELPTFQHDIGMTEFRQPLQVQSHLEMLRILVQLGHTQRT